jgi:hypothetical protein
VVITANDRDRLERLLRYAARPPFATDRLEQLSDGRLRYRFKTPWRDGTTHAVFSPIEFIEKIAALVPTPRAHLVRFSGVLGPAAKWRPQIVPAVVENTPEPVPPAEPPPAVQTEIVVPEAPESDPASPANEPVVEVVEEPKKKTGRRNDSWSELIRRVFAVDVTVCECGGKLRLISAIHPPVATRKILEHLGLPSRAPPLAPAARIVDIDIPLDWA